jgi:hypothetical protein
MKTFVQVLLESIHSAGAFNPADEVAPIAILWPDPSHIWAPVVTQLKRTGVTILTLGDFQEDELAGPALWVRSKLVDAVGSPEPVIIYMPGIQRVSMRALESCPSSLRPIAELQFRSSWWVAHDDSEWTPRTFLRSKGAHVSGDEATAEALTIALTELATVPFETFQGRKNLDAEYFNLLLVPDSVKTLLNWMDSDAAPNTGPSWKAFVNTCKHDFGIDPTQDGALTAAARMGDREGKWSQVWARFAEAPSAYPGILARLKQARDSIFVALYPDSWPQDNATAEEELSDSLVKAAQLGTNSEVRERITELDKEHAPRRDSIWSTLGKAPLAIAIGHLAELAKKTVTPKSSTSVADLREWYVSEGWAADGLVLSAIGSAPEGPQRLAVSEVIRAIYRDWADANARELQDHLRDESTKSDTGLELTGGECALFVDGLRYDVATRLRTALSQGGVGVDLRSRLAPFPSMTASGKPAVAPLASTPHGGSGFAPELAGKTLDAANLRAAMLQNGVAAFSETEYGDPATKGWTEAADLDKLGHKVDLKLVDHLDHEVAEIANRVQALLKHGWSRVHVVTDHGWLLVPGGLPVVTLDIAKTVIRKSRCAQLAEHAGSIDQPEYPWTWDSNVRVAVPRGIAAFEAGKVYDHGGVSPQETIVPHLVAAAADPEMASTRIEEVVWKGLRCRISGEGSASGLVVDLRLKPADSSTSVADSKSWSSDGTALLVQDDSLIGAPVNVVIVDANGKVVAQAATKIGG